MTTIAFKRSGGFVGQGMRFTLELNQLPAQEARHIVRLIEQAGFFNLPENSIVKFNPDEYQYTITVDVGIISHTIRTSDTTMPAGLRPLVDELSGLKSVAAEEGGIATYSKGYLEPSPKFDDDKQRLEDPK